MNWTLSFLNGGSHQTTLTVPLISLICEVLYLGINEVDDVCDEEECMEEEEEECGLCHSIYMRECDIKMEYKYTPVKEQTKQCKKLFYQNFLTKQDICKTNPNQYKLIIYNVIYSILLVILHSSIDHLPSLVIYHPPFFHCSSTFSLLSTILQPSIDHLPSLLIYHSPTFH